MQGLREEGTDPIREVVRICGHGNQLQVANAVANRDVELMREDNAWEMKAFRLSLPGFSQQILVLGEKHPSQGGSPI
jgi:hypothetical protein